MRLACAIAAAALGASAGPAVAVGLGPLRAEGLTAGERKGFYLTVINPYPRQERFRLYGVAWDSEAPAQRVHLPVRSVVLGARSQRRILVIGSGLAPGETHQFRVCAERVKPVGEAIINARVCSKLTARRRG
jgi:hypothetical protein